MYSTIDPVILPIRDATRQMMNDSSTKILEISVLFNPIDLSNSISLRDSFIADLVVLNTANNVNTVESERIRATPFTEALSAFSNAESSD